MDAALTQSDFTAEQDKLLSFFAASVLSAALMSASTSVTDRSISVVLSRDDSSDCTVADSTVDSGLSVTSDGANSLYLITDGSTGQIPAALKPLTAVATNAVLLYASRKKPSYPLFADF